MKRPGLRHRCVTRPCCWRSLPPPPHAGRKTGCKIPLIEGDRASHGKRHRSYHRAILLKHHMARQGACYITFEPPPSRAMIHPQLSDDHRLTSLALAGGDLPTATPRPRGVIVIVHLHDPDSNAPTHRAHVHLSARTTSQMIIAEATVNTLKR